jgi:hypothetical protein
MQDNERLIAQAVLDAVRGMLFVQTAASDCAPKKEAAAWWRAGALAINRRGTA